MIIGSTTTVEAAICCSGLDPASVVKTCRPQGSVRLLSVMITYIGHMKLFQLASAFRRITVVRELRAMGTITFQR